MGRRSNQLAPYFVQVREFERRLMRDALEAAGTIELAATTLGVTTHYVRARSRLLGGVFPDEPKNEPPGPALAAWNTTSPSDAVKGLGRREGKRGKYKRRPKISGSASPELSSDSKPLGDQTSLKLVPEPPDEPCASPESALPDTDA
jgi:hypothetical protein